MTSAVKGKHRHICRQLLSLGACGQAELCLLCILCGACNTVSFLLSKENTKCYTHGDNPPAKIITLIKHRPQKEGRDTESGGEEKHKSKGDMGRVNKKLRTRHWHGITAHPPPPGFMTKSEDITPALQAWQWWMACSQAQGLVQLKGSSPRSKPTFVCSSVLLSWSITVQHAPCSAQSWAL